ncbi:MAG: glycosyltransferase family 4 protein [Chloroflexi bacterium]|nr:glycosyltransferase family 4 protein [Chloroflexota bacterium]
MTRFAVDFVLEPAERAPGLSRAQEPLLRALARSGDYQLRPVNPAPGPEKLWFPALYGLLPARLLARGARLVHVGNAWYAHLVPLLRAPGVVTCHDVIELKDLRSGARAYRPHRAFHIEAAFRGMTRARYIACVSAATASDVAALCPSTEDRVRVIHSGLSPAFRPGEPDARVLRELGVTCPFVLYVGSEQRRKNLERLVEAVAEVRRRGADLGLVKVGGHQTGEGREALRRALARTGLRDRTVILDSIPDSGLVQLYRAAAVHVLPSLQEGFGFPALEAMACGCPSIVSAIPALCEVTAGAALAVDPLDARALADAIELAVSSPALREEMRDRGLRRAGCFSWERAARAYLSLYDEALSP